MARRKEERNSAKVTQKESDSFDSVVFKVMPKEFLGEGVERVAPVEAKSVPKPVPAPVVVPPAPVQPTITKPVAIKKNKRRGPVLLIVFGLLFLLGLSAAAVVLLTILSEEDPEPIVPVVEDPVVIPPVIEDPVEEEPSITQGIDTDSDGLTDREEALYGTDARNPDTDGDTFLDGNEVFHRYDPLGFAPSTLLDTGSVVEYRSEVGGYALTYPRQWSLTSTEGAGITLRAQTGATIGVIDYGKSAEQAFSAWLGEVYPQIVSTDLKQGLTKAGYVSYTTDDQRTAFLVFDSRVVVFTYTLGNSLVIDYLQTFQMMVNSFFLE